MYDIIIIGAGPAGISAAIYAVSRGKHTLVIEKNKVGGTIAHISTVTHYSGIIEHETGDSFSNRLKAQAINAGVTIVSETVTEVTLTGTTKTVTTDSNTYQAKKVILANGSTPRKLGIPGELDFQGHGIGLNAVEHGAIYAGKDVYVIGGADGAIKEALYLAKIARKVTIIHFESKLSAIPEFMKQLDSLENVEILTDSRLTAVYGKTEVDQLEICNTRTGLTTTIDSPGCGIFVYAGSIPNTSLYHDLTLKDGYIVVNDKMETSIPGVYAAGDICVKQVRQIATAVADGAIAGIQASYE